ncbi:hypothetical protein [Paraburkholderia humisilvae]
MRKMTSVPPFDALAKSYGAQIARFRGLSIISIACNVERSVDIGFTARPESSLAPFFRLPPRFEIAHRVFAYGPGLLSAGELIRGDEVLCSALKFLLSNFRCTVEWSGQRVSVRVGVGVADADATGGQRFLSNLALVANRLGDVGRHRVVVNRRGEGFGPARLRKITLTAAFIVPLVLLFTVKYWISRGS